MIEFSEQSYWITLAHLPKWGTEKINKLIVKIHQKGMNLTQFFELSESEWKSEFELEPAEINELENGKRNLPNNSFLAEDLLSQGFDIIPISSPEYSKILKKNLKSKFSPPVLYTKGNKQIFEEDSIAIVGSRNAGEISLNFTDNIARLAAQKYKVVVSGFAKGVDQKALDSSLKYQGRSIIVLPQGILTFSSGIKKYYRQIVNGDVLVLSTFHPNAVWSVGLAMARNPIIYGLAEEIYVAESGDNGGTWEGVKKGLQMGRKIFVRLPDPDEKNANHKLISSGAVAVDFEGNEIGAYQETAAVKEFVKESVTSEKEIGLEEIIEILRKSENALSAKEISGILNNAIKPQGVTKLLKSVSEVSKTKSKPVRYFLPKEEISLFSTVDEDKIPEMEIRESDTDIIHSAELEILSLDFSWTTHWRFMYQGHTIKAKFTDNNFIQRVDSGEYSFAKGDMIYADIRKAEKGVDEYEIVKVVRLNKKSGSE